MQEISQRPFPLMVFLKNKRVVVVGGGTVATRRIQRLLPTGAMISVISPEISDDLKSLVDKRAVKWFNKQYTPADSADALLVIAATNSRAVNQFVSEHVRDDQLINVVSEAERGNVHFPSTYANGDLTIAISTNGASPKLTRKMKRDLAEMYDDTYVAYIAFIKEMRRKITRQSNLSEQSKSELLEQLTRDEYVTSDHARDIFRIRLQEQLDE